MNLKFKNSRIVFLLVCLAALLVLLPRQSMATEETAKDISDASLVTESKGFSNHWFLFDQNRRTGFLTEKKAHLTLSYQKGIGSLYLTFNESYPSYLVVNMDTGEEKIIDNGYVHAFLDLVDLFGEAPKKVQLRFESGQVALFEMKVYTAGKVPDSVQNWSAPVEGKTDIVLFSAHSDDDQLFFAGLLPYYAVERGYQVQVVYLTNHWNTYKLRMHEALDGLWAAGVRTYPVFAPYPDFFNANTLSAAFEIYEDYGYDRDEMTAFVVEQLRRFKPMVAVGHDLDGEYGHIQHKVYAQLLIDAVAVSGDAQVYSESASAYGVWDVPKTYLHLYKENPIVMDLDTPMENFEGLTPYEVSKDRAFTCHGSQYETWRSFFIANKASSITQNSPCQYGLYRTIVGDDVEKNDMFENLISHAGQDQLAQEEAERLAAEQAAEQVRLEEEKAVQESRAEEAARREMAEQAVENQNKLKLLADAAWILGAIALAIILVVAVINNLRMRYVYREDDFQGDE